MKNGLILFALACPLFAVSLVEQGKSNYTIVVAESAAPAEQRAAQELQRFVQEMSGARLPIAHRVDSLMSPRVFIGRAAIPRQLGVEVPAALGPEGFIIQTHGMHLVIAGGGQRGTMYGVTAFLERLGCRWFTTEISRIPKLPTIKLGSLDVMDKPAFEYREPFFAEAFDKDWAARNRTNGMHSQLDESTGGKLIYQPFVHSFNELLPPDKYFAEHPEYYSLIDGKRRRERSQLCLTNPDVQRLVVQRVREWTKEHPEATIFSVSQNDWEGWCECDRCRRAEMEEGGVHSGPLLRFVNSVAAEIAKTNPDKLIDTLAYWYTEDPPAHVRPLPNVRIRLCPIGICVAHSFASCPRSAYMYRNLQAWAKITNQLYVWHYNTDFSHYLLPFPDFDELAADIPLYKKNGVVGLFMQGDSAAGGGGENAWLRSYVLARQLWNPAVDVKAVIDEFMQGVYGPAAGPMKKYFDLLHSETGTRHLWIFNVPDYSDSLIPQGLKLFDEAARLATNDAARKLIDKERLSLEYLTLLKEREYAVRDGMYQPKDLNTLQTHAAAFLQRVRAHGITRLHEHQGLEADEAYYKELKAERVVKLENDAWRASIVPALNARVVELYDKRGRREVLRAVPPGDGGYPNTGGIFASLYPDQHGKSVSLDWSVETATATEARLRATAKGLDFRCTYRLTANGLSVETEALNTGAEAQPVALQVRADLEPVDIDAARVQFKNISSENVERRFIAPGEIPNGRETYDGAKRPAGEWRVEPAGVANTFDGVDRAVVTWSAKSRPLATLLLWSPEKTLAPKESVRLTSNYGR